jgi:NAD(P)-dependent dehydrogenase (short-subunit alcohol dehydrogenase family)
MKNIVVTGASTGIGWGICKVLTAQGFRVFGSVRKEADGARLTGEFGPLFTPLLFDITDTAAVAAAARQVETALAGETLFALVNNAGIAVPGPLLYLPLADFEKQLAVNVTGQLIVTQAFAPLMGKGGRIVMMSSVGGSSGTPFMGAYNASKYALEGMSEALRRELILLGIDVIIVAPGAVATPIWDKGDAMDPAPFVRTPYAAPLKAMRKFMLDSGHNGLPPEQLGMLVHKALTIPHPRVKYVLTPDRLRYFLLRRLPKRLVDRLVAKMLGLLPQKG